MPSLRRPAQSSITRTLRINRRSSFSNDAIARPRRSTLASGPPYRHASRSWCVYTRRRRPRQGSSPRRRPPGSVARLYCVARSDAVGFRDVAPRCDSRVSDQGRRGLLAALVMLTSSSLSEGSTTKKMGPRVCQLSIPNLAGCHFREGYQLCHSIANSAFQASRFHPRAAPALSPSPATRRSRSEPVSTYSDAGPGRRDPHRGGHLVVDQLDAAAAASPLVSSPRPRRSPHPSGRARRHRGRGGPAVSLQESL